MFSTTGVPPFKTYERSNPVSATNPSLTNHNSIGSALVKSHPFGAVAFTIAKSFAIASLTPNSSIEISPR